MNYPDPQSNISNMIGQMIMVGLRGHTKNDVNSFFDSIKGYSIGGVILYDENITTSPYSPHNIRSPKQLINFTKAIQNYNDTPLLIAIDQEGGKVNRLKSDYGFPESKSWAELGKIDELKITKENSELMAQTLEKHGFNLNFAPVLDLSNNNKSFIAKKERCLSKDAKKIIAHSKEFIKTHLDNNVLTVGKHFPGQGSAIGDTHDSFVDVSETWSSNELLPYKELIKNKTLNAIMISHLFHNELDKIYPATLSKLIIKNLLRDKMGFDGVVISDDPQMKAISKQYNLETVLELMVNASVDIFCFGNNLVYDRDIVKKIHITINKLLYEGKVSVNHIKKSYERIQNMKSLINLK